MAGRDYEEKVDPMWSADEDDRRVAIARKAASGARKALAALAAMKAERPSSERCDARQC